MAQKIKKGDPVIVIAGKDKGRVGEVIRFSPDDQTVLVAGLNLHKKHIKANPQRNIEGKILEKEGPIHVSNVALIDPTTQKPSKVGFKILETGKKVRYLKSNQEIVDK